MPFYHLRDSKYLRAKILHGVPGKLHLLLADRHVLPRGKLGLRYASANSPGLHKLRYREDIRIGHS